MESITIPRGDYGQYIQRTLYQTNGSTVFNLLGYTVNLEVWEPHNPDTLVLNEICTITDEAGGEVEYQIQDGDFEIETAYYAKFVAAATGERISFEVFKIVVAEGPTV